MARVTFAVLLIVLTGASALSVSTSPATRTVRIERLQSAGAQVVQQTEHQEAVPPLTILGMTIHPSHVGEVGLEAPKAECSIHVRNDDPQREVVWIEWRLDIYDKAGTSVINKLVLSKSSKIKPGKDVFVVRDMGTIGLPPGNPVQVLITAVKFADGSKWAPDKDPKADTHK